MSLDTATTARPSAVALPRIGGGRPDGGVGFGRLVAVECRKQVDTRAGRWLLVIIAVATAVVLGIMLVVDGGRHTFGAYLLGTSTPQALLLPIVGILAVTAEWSQRTALTTFALEPRRARVAAAKMLSALLVGAAAFVLAVVLAAATHLLAMGARGVEPHWSVPAQVVLGMALMVLLSVAQGVGFGMLLLNTPAAIVVYLVLPTVWSFLATTVARLRDAAGWLDLNTTMNPLLEGHMSGDQWERLATSAAVWVGLPVALGLWRIVRSEVK